MAHLFRKKNETIFGTGNSPLAGGRVHYYIAGTTTRLDTYEDQAGSTINDNPVILNADGDFPTNVYLGEANDYKEVIETADSSSSTTIDNIPKAQAATTTLLVQSPSFVWTTVSALNTILDETQVGKAFAANTQNNNVTFLLPNPALSQNGPTLVFKKINASNDLILQDHLGGAYLTISNDGDSVLLSSNGAEWHVVSDLNSSQGGSIADDEVTNAKLANVGSGTFKGRMTAGVGDPEDLGPAAATSLLNEFSPDNDTDAPGVKGLVPAPAIGDASAGKILSAGGTWIDPPSGGSASLNPATGGLVGVNATADVNNRLSINSPASLFNHEGSNHQLKVNKNTNTDTASVLFQTGFSGRAEFGLTGDDDFHMKVSPDGSTFYEGIVIDKDTGEVSFPNTSIIGGDVVGPASATDNALARFEGTTGKLLQDSAVSINDSGNMLVAGRLGAGNDLAIGDIGAVLHLQDDGAFQPQVLAVSTKDDQFGPYWSSRKARGGTSTNASDDLGTFVFQGMDSGGNSRNAAYISCKAESIGSTYVTGSFYLRTVNTSGVSNIVQQLNATGSVLFPQIATTASAANAHLDGSNSLLKSTSSLRYKKDVEPLWGDLVYPAMKVKPIWYRSKSEYDNPDHSWIGFAAEDVAEVEPRLASWTYHDEDYESEEILFKPADPETGEEAVYETKKTLKKGAEKKPDGVFYERFVVIHQAVLQDLLTRVSELESKLKDLPEGA